MKKFTLSLMAIFLIAFFADAQIKKGAVLLGGGLLINTYNSVDANNNNKNKLLSFSPSVGVAVKDNTVAGIGLIYSYATIKSNGSPTMQEYKAAGSSVFLRRYLPLGKNFYLFGEGDVYYLHTSNNQVQLDYSNNTKMSIYGLTIYPGITYAVNRHFHLEASINNLLNINYNKTVAEYRSLNGNNSTTTHGFGLASNLSSTVPLSIGFRFVIGK